MRTKTGYMVEISTLSIQDISDLYQAVEWPEVPKQFVEALGREEENPNDPDYVQALEEANDKLSSNFVHTFLINCVTIKSDNNRFEKWLSKYKWQVEVLKTVKPPKEFDLNNEFAAHTYYLLKEVFKHSDDLAEAISKATVDGKSIEALGRSFRSEGESNERVGLEDTTSGEDTD